MMGIPCCCHHFARHDAVVPYDAMHHATCDISQSRYLSLIHTLLAITFALFPLAAYIYMEIRSSHADDMQHMVDGSDVPVIPDVRRGDGMGWDGMGNDAV